MDKRLMKKTFGFTLIEMMIAVAIVGIIAAIALPSYQASVRKSNRAEAKTELNDIAQRLQRCYTLYASFNHASCGVYSDLTDANFYTTRGGQFYTIKIGVPAAGNPAATTYRLTASPVTGKAQAQDVACDKFTLDHTGGKKAFSGSTDTTDKCW